MNLKANLSTKTFSDVGNFKILNEKGIISEITFKKI